MHKVGDSIMTNKPFLANRIHFFATFVVFLQVGSLFRQVGSVQSYSQVSGNPVESRRSELTASSVPFSSAEIKIAVSLCAA